VPPPALAKTWWSEAQKFAWWELVDSVALWADRRLLEPFLRSVAEDPEERIGLGIAHGG